MKKYSQSLKAYPKLSFQIQLKGDVEMDYKIVEIDAFTVIGKSISTATLEGENNRKIASFWVESNSNGFVSELAKNCGSLGILGICLEMTSNKKVSHI